MDFMELYEDYVNQRITAQVSTGTLRVYSYTLRPFTEWCGENGIQPDTIGRRQVRDYVGLLSESGKAAATVDLHGRCIRALLKHGHREGICQTIDFTGLLPRPPVRRKYAARQEDIDKLLEKASSLRDKAIVLLMFQSGVRRQEASDLDWDHLDWTPKDVLRVRVYDGKGTKDRITFTGRQAKLALLRYRSTVPHDEGDPVFTSHFHRRLGVQGLDHVYMKLGEMAGVKITPHAVRRGFAVSHRGMPIFDLMKLMGHSSPQTTLLYISTNEDDLLESYRAHDVT